MSENPNTKAREFAVQFLYQCEMEKIYYFSDSHFTAFVQHQQVPTANMSMLRELVRGTLDQVHSIDERVQAVSTNWKLSRMSVIDRNVLRMATFELLRKAEPLRVVLNEAVELGKKYGSEDSARFINGILDKIAKGS